MMTHVRPVSRGCAKKEKLLSLFSGKNCRKTGTRAFFSCGATHLGFAFPQNPPCGNRDCSEFPLPDNGAAAVGAYCKQRSGSGRPRKAIQNSRCRRAFTLPRLSAGQVVLFLLFLLIGFAVKFKFMILQSAQKVNTVFQNG